MKLYILRHGDAAEPAGSGMRDHERPLTPKGIQRTRQLASALREMEISFDAVLSSPLVRARETAEIVLHELQNPVPLALTDSLSPSGNVEALIEKINSLKPIPENALLVGHEPFLSCFISLLCTGLPGLPLTMKKGALCRLEIGLLTCSQCAILEWLLQPKLLALKSARRRQVK